jgi:ElaB/YqjD/DUF883 family membrane-anchored ribosome-binding protein
MEQTHMNALLRDLEAVVADAESLLKASAGHATEEVAAARERAQKTVRHARERLNGAAEHATARGRAAATAADHYVHENPWGSLAAVAAAAFLLGIALGRR